MYFAVSWLEPRLRINTTASEWTEEKTGPRDVSLDISIDVDINMIGDE